MRCKSVPDRFTRLLRQGTSPRQWETLLGFSWILLYALAGWLVVSLPLGAISYRVALPLLLKARQRRKSSATP